MVARLWHAYNDHLETIDCWECGGESVDPELADLAAHYPEEDGGILLAEEQDTIMGTVALNRVDEDRGEIRRLFVLPEHQKKGLGKKLMQAALELAKTKPYRTILLDTFREQPGPQALYRAFGFAECEPFNDYAKDKVIWMEKPL